MVDILKVKERNMIPTLDEWIEQNCSFFSENIKITLEQYDELLFDKEIRDDLYRMIMTFYRQEVEGK